MPASPSPSPSPYKTELLRVSAGHQLHLAHYGCPHGPLVVCVHGGPGGASDPRRVWSLLRLDPTAFHVLFFDQRGCGLSRPRDALEGNTPAHTVADIERIRRHCHAPRLLLFGGSYGSALALLYACAHPARVAGLVLRSVYLLGDVLSPTLRRRYPQVWRTLQQTAGASEFQRVCERTSARLLAGHDDALARAWCAMENQEFPASQHGSRRTQHSLALFEATFQAHRFFVPPTFDLLRACAALRGVPTLVFHGADDAICPVHQARRVCSRIGASATLHVVRDTGHNPFAPRMRAAMRRHLSPFATACFSSSSERSPHSRRRTTHRTTRRADGPRPRPQPPTPRRTPTTSSPTQAGLPGTELDAGAKWNGHGAV